MATTMSPAPRVASAWWLYLISGILCVLFGTVLLSIQLEDLVGDSTREPAYILTVLIGAYLIWWGLIQFFGALLARGTAWLVFAIGGVLAVLGGIAAISWPDITLFILVLFVGWSLIIWGIIDVIGGFSIHGAPYWWAYLVRGVASIVIGILALRHDTVTIEVLVFIVAAQAILWGIGDLVAAHLFHGAKKDWMAMSSAGAGTTTAAPRRTATPVRKTTTATKKRTR